MVQGMKTPQKEDLFANDYGRPITRLIEKEGSAYEIVLKLFSEFCTGKYENYLDNKQVEKFIGWLEQNKEHLQKNIETILNNRLVEGDLRTEEQVYYAIGFIIGGQYVLGKYTDYDEEVDGKKVKLWAKGGGAQWIGSRMEINMGIPQGVINLSKKPDPREAFVGFLRGLNTGIHEYAHGLRKFDGMDDKSLTETGVSLICRNLTLSIYYKDTDGIHLGIRDPLRFFEQIRDGKVGYNYADIINDEYLGFILSPWISAYFEKDSEGVPKEFLLNCVYAKDTILYKIKDIYLKRELFKGDNYIKNIPDEKVRDILSAVFDKLMNETWKTPKEFFEKLFDALDEGFGCRPSPMEAPDGFVYFMPKEREKRNAFMG